MFFWKTAKETVPERPIRISSVEWRDGQQSSSLFFTYLIFYAPAGKKMSSSAQISRCRHLRITGWPRTISGKRLPGRKNRITYEQSSHIL